MIKPQNKHCFHFLNFQIDPTMMAALMASSSLINAGANTEEVSSSY